MSIDLDRLKVLPLWAQQLIKHQDKKIDQLRRAIVERDAPENCPTTNLMVECELGDYARDRKWRPSPHRVARFQLTEHDGIECSIRETAGERRLYVWGADLIIPESANTFLLGLQ